MRFLMLFLLVSCGTEEDESEAERKCGHECSSDEKCARAKAFVCQNATGDYVCCPEDISSTGYCFRCVSQVAVGRSR